MSIVQKKVKEYIKDKGWSIVTTAQKSGIPLATVKSIIYGKSTNQKISTLEKLADAFDCNVSDLTGETSNAKNQEIDFDLFKECMYRLEEYVSSKHLMLSEEKKMRTVDNLFSLYIKKKQHNNQYTIDDDTIDWMINNLA